MIPFLENLCKYPMQVIYLFFLLLEGDFYLVWIKLFKECVSFFASLSVSSIQETSKMFILLSYWKDFVYL